MEGSKCRFTYLLNNKHVKEVVFYMNIKFGHPPFIFLFWPQYQQIILTNVIDLYKPFASLLKAFPSFICFDFSCGASVNI